MKAVVIQMNVGTDKAANLRKAADLIDKACEVKAPDLIMLPESFTFFGGTRDEQRASAEACPGGDSYQMLKDKAAYHKVFIHGGSLNEQAGNKVHNTTIVFDRSGREVARYRKIHMFSITAPDGTVYDERWLYEAGTDIVTYDLDGVTVGCTICYDLRFPELFRALVDKGAKVIAAPAAFTLQTGKEHWEALLRARAIETQCYVLAPGQEGAYVEDGKTYHNYGHSLIVEPWGTVVARRGSGDGLIEATLEPEAIERVRSLIPLARHRGIRLAAGL